MDPTIATDDVVSIDKRKAETICRMGQGEKCCAFLAIGTTGIECVRGHRQFNGAIVERLREGSMVAKARGGWQGCYWRGQIPDDDHREVGTASMMRMLQAKYDRLRAAAEAVVGVTTREDLIGIIEEMNRLYAITHDSDLAQAKDLAQALLDTME